jgi:hypothetical protein
LVSIFLISFIVSLIFPALFFLSFHYLLVTEIVPEDQHNIPKPMVGHRISVYGVWVEEIKPLILFLGGWHEIHPVRYVDINGVGYGIIPYNGSLFNGVHTPERFNVLDKQNPYRIANGTVMDVFTNLDGDYHVHILVNENYQNLIKMNFIMFTYGEILRWTSILPFFIIGAYIIVSFLKPQHTLFGRFISRNGRNFIKNRDKTTNKDQ